MLLLSSLSSISFFVVFFAQFISVLSVLALSLPGFLFSVCMPGCLRSQSSHYFLPKTRFCDLGGFLFLPLGPDHRNLSAQYAGLLGPLAMFLLCLALNAFLAQRNFYHVQCMSLFYF